MLSPLQFLPPVQWQHDVLITYKVPADCNYSISFSKPTLKEWGLKNENFILEQRHIQKHFGLVLLTISVSRRCELPVECVRNFNALQYSLKGNIIGYLKGFGYLSLFEKTGTIQYVASGNYKVWLEPGLYTFLYLIISNEQMEVLANEHLHLSELINRIRDSHNSGIMLDRIIVDMATLRLINRLKDIHLTATQLNLELVRIIAEFLSIYDEQIKIKLDGGISTASLDIAYHIKAYIADNLTDPAKLTNEALANLFHLTVKTFIRTWEKAFGETPHSFILKMRMNLSLYILMSEKITVVDVAERLGYQDYRGFSKEFIKHFSFSPKQAIECF